MKLLRIDWMEVGKEYLLTQSDTDKVLNEAKTLVWENMPSSLPYCQGEAIKTMIKEMPLRKVSKIAIGGGFGLSCEPSAGFGFYGIQNTYADCIIRLHVLDTGVSVTPLFIEVYEKEAINNN